MYHLSNASEIIWNGDLLMGAKLGSFLTIKQNDVKIIATVSSEQIIDQQNKVNSIEFDNRYSENSINRIILLKTQGVIVNDEFNLTSKYVPMVGNEVTLTNKNDLNKIYSVGKNNSFNCISIGDSIRDGESVPMPINNIFASHIGIFGNTGSGKSNTLHKLYLELFRSKYFTGIIEKSKFFVLDFNGEYCQEGQFGIYDNSYKKIFYVGKSLEDKVPVKRSYFMNVEVLSILFDAKPGVQVPFIKKAMKKFININDGTGFSRMEIGLLKKLMKEGRDVSDWLEASELLLTNDDLNGLHNMSKILNYGNNQWKLNGQDLFINGIFTEYGTKIINFLRKKLEERYNELSELKKLNTLFIFQSVYETSWNKTNSEFLSPLLKRISNSLIDLNDVIELVDDISNCFACMNIISLVYTNKEMKRIVPMLISKMIYIDQKNRVSKNGLSRTVHLIIDEAHNILNRSYNDSGDHWKDYRLSTFDDIIKEGRKFGFFMTLSSQRPSDISPTIISQLHNYFIHKIVNENDLNILENTMPTLDRSSYKSISSLGVGECMITGNAFKIPTIIKVNRENKIRPNSDNVILTELWDN